MLVYARLRKGVVGETRRSVHLVDIPIEAVNALSESPTALYALCGEAILPGTAERLDRLAGMPCALCLIRSPGPAHLGPMIKPTQPDA